VIETLAEIILSSASARLVSIEAATKDKPTLVFFRFTSGDAQEHVLPITELSEHNRSARVAERWRGMNRRDFLCLVAGALAIQLADEGNHQWLRRPERQSEKAPIYVDEIDPNYRRFRQRLRELFEDGHGVLRWELHAPRGGFRFVRVYLKEGPPLTWNQPWEGECRLDQTNELAAFKPDSAASVCWLGELHRWLHRRVLGAIVGGQMTS